jgi:hypothetical protein
MGNLLRDTFLKNFTAAIDMFGDVIRLCPETMWQTNDRFFYMAYHTAIFLDYYLTQPVNDFAPILPYHIAADMPKDAIDDVIANRRYTKTEMLEWLNAIGEKCKIVVSENQNWDKRWITPDEIPLHDLCPPIVEKYTIVEILFYNFSHLQHHTGQLNLMLRDQADTAADWIAQA